MQRSEPKPTSKLFQQDIVQKICSPEYYGVVSRSWHDEDIPPNMAHGDPLMRPLAHGEVGVTFISHGDREILPESELRLVDRFLQPGDYCKKSFDDVQAGVVTSMKVKARVAHAISNDPIQEWYTIADFHERGEADIGDYVVFDDWIGQIIEVFDEAIVEVSQGRHLVRLPELGSRLAVGESGSDILPPDPQRFWRGGPHEDNDDTVIAVKHSTYAITWLALNQMLDPDTSEKKIRPKKFWFGEDLGQLTLIRTRGEKEIRFGDRVHLKIPTGKPVTRHGQPEDPTGIVHVQTFLVSQTETELEVLWQNGSKEMVKAVDVIPYLNTDEYDCWPGDHVLWKNEQEIHQAIVQSVNAVERTSLILLLDTGKTELASLLELDTVGNMNHNQHLNPDAFGVQRGDVVFINPPGSYSAAQQPHVARIGEIEPWVREDPLPDGQLADWRKELFEIGTNIASKRGLEHFGEKPIQRPMKGDGKLLWIGEVTELNLDGTVEVTHPDQTAINYPLNRLTLLYDGIEQLEAEVWNMGDGDQSQDEGHEEEWVDNDEHGPLPNAEQDGDSSFDVEGRGRRADYYNMELDDFEDDDHPMQIDPEHRSTETFSAMDISDPQGLAPNLNSRLILEPLEVSARDQVQQTGTVLKSGTEEFVWSRFEIIPSAPVDHAFFSSAPAQPSKTFLSRLRKEYRILQSSLPDSILVRAYEDRTDLLRSLIIGPENTPYQDAPFVIDWMLDSNFPNSPPIAHFLSWTNGNGRVNPNLYEEGKVCLSILGTWSGDKHEVWSAARSSLLQALVSIQGLVLVKEPWFCEPAYEKLRGTQEGTVNSRLYSEKAYVISRGFVRRALEIPLGGLEAEMSNLYYKQGRLEKVINHAEFLIATSKSNSELLPEDQDLAIPRLSGGGIITLERTLTKLQALQYRQSTSP